VLQDADAECRAEAPGEKQHAEAQEGKWRGGHGRAGGEADLGEGAGKGTHGFSEEGGRQEANGTPSAHWAANARTAAVRPGGVCPDPSSSCRAGT